MGESQCLDDNDPDNENTGIDHLHFTTRLPEPLQRIMQGTSCKLAPRI